MVLRYEQLPQKVLWYLQVASEPNILREDGNGDLPQLITRDSCNRFRHGAFCSHDKTAYMLSSKKLYKSFQSESSVTLSVSHDIYNPASKLAPTQS